MILSNGQMDLHIFIGASIVCLCSAGLANTARYIPAYLSFVIPSLSLFIISTFYYSEAMMYSCAALAILSMASLIYFGKRNEQTYKNQFFLNMNHEKLIKQYAITQKALITEKNKAERADAVKTDFLAIMSHEIRTPMNGLLGTIDLLQETELNEIQRKYISIAQETGKSLHYLLNDILDLIRLDEGSISLNPTNFNIKTATDTIRGTFSPIAIKNNIQLIFNISTNVPEHLYADDYKIRQVINNLISNALKFTSSGKVEIDFSLSGSDIDGDFLVVHVKDTGSGIPISFQKNIFKKFSQLDATKLRKKGGAGLGLAISKGIVELMNGDIGFTSEEGVGSDFWFTCPIIIPDNITHDTNDNNMDFIQNINGNQHKILIVDDSETNRFITREMLNNLNFNLSEVSSGDHAIKKAMDEHFDLILMDISMPEMDGIEAMKKIKALSEAHKNIPIIA
ncbi:MAG: response regulator, partial [Emcibacteraceae bacterium]|nr:response regulator [Emcibacteraceae bacterium]